MSQYKSYPAYKDSRVEWIGEVPEHWNVVPIKYHYDARLGKMIQPVAASDSDIAVPYHRAQTVQWEGVVESDIKEMWASIKDIEQFSVKKGDLLICEGGDVCRAAIVQESPASNMIFQNSIHRVRPRGEHGVGWILRLMQHLRSSSWVDVLCNKNTIVHFTSEKLGSLECPLPPPEEQAIIESALKRETARIDTLIAKKTRFIELLKEKRQAVITKAVTKGLDDSVEMKDSGVEWLGSVPYHWKVVPLKHLLEGALQYGATESGETFIEEWPRYIRITDIDSHGRLRSEGAKSLDPSIAEPYLIKKWDILFARSGATVGKSFVYEGEDYKACFAGYMIRASVNPSLICSEYLYFYLQSHSYWEYIVGSQSQATIQNVSAEKYGALFVPLPPIEEQSNLLTFLKKTTSRLDELISRTERSIELLKEKRSALITAAVTGKIDVREAA